jgi:phosphatidate cytidylyltransferase
MNPTDRPPSPPVAGNPELRLRILSAAVIGPVALGLTVWGGTGYLLLVVFCATVMASEWATITLGRSFAPRRLAFLALAAATTLAFGVLVRLPALFVPALIVALAGIALGFFLASREARASRDAASDAATWAPLGAIYAILPPVALIALREGDLGLYVVIFLFAVVWSTDIAAYFTGRAVGGPKIWPAVSPKKTWSGGLGGLAAAVVAGTLVAWVAGAPSLAPMILLCAVLSIAAQAGDFFESALKRRFGVKDSGRIIPGHGGILDRVDGLVAAAVVAFVVVLVHGGGDSGALLVW